MSASAAAAPPAPSPHHHHRWWVATLLTLAVIIGFLAILSTWVKRQALDTNNWTNTSTKLLADPRIQTAVAGYMVNELFSNVDVAATLRQRLPQQAQALAGPAAAGLRQLADRAAPEILARPRVQDAWRLANRTAHQQLISILNGRSGAVTTTNGEVVLDLRALVTQLATALGVGGRLPTSSPLPASAGKIVVMRSKQLKAAQDIAKLIRSLSIVFTVLSFLLFAAAIWLASGWRRVALRTTGWCFAGLGFVILVFRRVGGNAIVNGLVPPGSTRPAAHDAWLIGTSLLRAIALAFVIYGLLIVAAAWLAGPTRPALFVRQSVAPALRDHLALSYAAAGFVYILVLLWGPTPAFRHIIPVLLIAGLLVWGIELLRRQTAAEFPDARPGDAIHAPAFGSRFARTPSPAQTIGNGESARLAQLERLASLHNTGALTDEEYTTEKDLLRQS